MGEKNESLHLHWKKKFRPIRILMNDLTFRTHLVDDSSCVVDIITEITGRFGTECAFDNNEVDTCRYEFLDASKTLRDQGFPADLKAGLVKQQNNVIELFAVIPYWEDKIVFNDSGKWKKSNAVLKKNILTITTTESNDAFLASKFKTIEMGGCNDKKSKKFKDLVCTITLKDNSTIILASSSKQKLKQLMKEI